VKRWFEENRKLVINACLAGLYVGLTAFTASGGVFTWSALAGAAILGLRFAVGYIAKGNDSLPTIPVDE